MLPQEAKAGGACTRAAYTMTFRLRTFQAVQPSLFSFNTSGQPGGYADFAHFTVDEPRARSIERVIPIGKSVTPTCDADGSPLAADTPNDVLANVPGDGADRAAENVRFQVVDLNLGRVALKATGDRFVSADAEVLKDLAGAVPGEAESFQWINLVRGRHDAHIAHEPSLRSDQAEQPRAGHGFRHRTAARPKG